VTVGENSRVGAGSVVLSRRAAEFHRGRRARDIVYHNGQRVLITDPHEIKDPLSDALIALSVRVDELEERLGATEPSAQPFADEEAERAAYTAELERLRV